MHSPIRIPITSLPHHASLAKPAYASSGASGMDLYAAIEEDMVLDPGRRCLVPTGIAIAIPEGYEVQIRPRSGLAFKHGITCLNTPGTIDADYRGEIKVILAHLGEDPFTITRGDRIAQMVLARVEHIEWETVESLDATERGSGGFGSTGHQ